MKHDTTLLVLVLLAGLMQGCLQQNTVGDTTQQEINRQNGAATTLEAQYGQMKGQYVGTYNDSTVLLTLDVARQTSTGNGDLGLVPQPTIVGTLQLEPPISVKTVSGKPMLTSFSVTAGQYVSGNDLTLTVQQNGAPTTAHCLVTNLDLDCNWYLNASTAPRANFQLRRITDGQALSTDSRRTQGEYVGSDSIHHDIIVRFSTKLDLQSGSAAIPQNTIGATIVMDGVVFQSKGSEFDPINNTLVIVLAGTNPINVDCTIINADTLRCVWSGKNGDGSVGNNGDDEVFDLTRSS